MLAHQCSPHFCRSRHGLASWIVALTTATFACGIPTQVAKLCLTADESNSTHAGTLEIDLKSACFRVDLLKVGHFPSAFRVIRVFVHQNLLPNIERIGTKVWTLLAATKSPETGAKYMRFRGPDPRLGAVL